MYQRVEDYAESGDYVGNEDGTRDLTPAYAKAKHDLANPIDEDTFYSSESFGKLQDTVNSITDVSSFLDLSEDYGGETGTVSNALEVKQDIRKMAEREMRYSRASSFRCFTSSFDQGLPLFAGFFDILPSFFGRGSSIA
ncbi:hypothetical protein HKX42_03805 [Salinisphaera sp. USBA-960]|nr:hypothetical protein [Salifodinibacter halophilus]NNC26002.1 hypothetical protein [Salifodinibacter halophilus]